MADICTHCNQREVMKIYETYCPLCWDRLVEHPERYDKRGNYIPRAEREARQRQLDRKIEAARIEDSKIPEYAVTAEKLGSDNAVSPTPPGGNGWSLKSMTSVNADTLCFAWERFVLPKPEASEDETEEGLEKV